MPYIATQNPDITDRISKLFRIKDWLRLFNSPRLIPVVVVNDAIYNNVTEVLAATAAQAATTSTDLTRQFVMTGFNFSGFNTGAGTGTSTLFIVQNGAQKSIANLAFDGASHDNITMTFPKWLKIDPNTNISVTNTANATATAYIYGFYEKI